MTTGLSKSERVVHVNFSGARPDFSPELPGHGRGCAPTHRESNVQAPASIVAVALLIARKASADTVDGDLDAICRLLRHNCAWSDESLTMLKRTVATALAHARQSHPRGIAAD